MGWKKALAIIGISLAVLLVAAGIGVYALSRPAALVPYHDGFDPAERDLQTKIGVGLRIAGIDATLVRVTNGTATAAYLMPESNETDAAEGWQRVVLGVLAPLAPETTTLVAIQLVDEKPSLAWSVPTAKVLAYAEGKLTADELEAAITKE